MAAIQVYHEFHPKLIATLPMKDSIFTSKLMEQCLLSADLIDEVNAKQTSQNAAEYFLKIVIEPCFDNNNNGEPLQKLLSVMEEFSEPLKSLVNEIKHKLSSRVSSTNGKLSKQSLSLSG